MEKKEVKEVTEVKEAVDAKTATEGQKKEKQAGAAKTDFKAELKKIWRGFVSFLSPFVSLDRDVLLSKTSQGFLQRHVRTIYFVGCVILAIFAIGSLFRFPAVMAVVGQLVVVSAVFVIFRMLCEIISRDEDTSTKKK
jgi:hypothetical protein